MKTPWNVSRLNWDELVNLGVDKISKSVWKSMGKNSFLKIYVETIFWYIGLNMLLKLTPGFLLFLLQGMTKFKIRTHYVSIGKYC